MGALNHGSSIRQTDATAINAKSSRSHAVFSLNLVQRKSTGSMMTVKEKRMSVPVESMSGSDNSVTVDSKMHFVDLAGSERLKNTGASGERAKEGISINAGLASLGKVISQLSTRQANAHVSYRDSKLTRLLQDSLGGNAITYMIACVNPAEFHLSETLNTIQYAQRARAIQSKPRIQQVADDSDKQAVIDRLRAEVQFLRQQIRSSEGGPERRPIGASDRSERQTEREIELQNSLLDAQESYTALSQRHAKLIAELTKASEEDKSGLDSNNIAVESAVERLKRSSSFAESVEQVVLEYEKTIQSLESSLTNTRSSLSYSESNLLERETKCAYVETLNQQLQARLRKMAERENSTETYLRDLEAKLDNHSNGEEKNSVMVAELRKEIARARENEAGCEDYITTLEERLAEADQDMELMQREIDRLEHVVERQRSLGKLDSLLAELDQSNANGTNGEKEAVAEEPTVKKSTKTHLRTQTLDTLKEAAETAIPEEDDDLGEHPPEIVEEEAEENAQDDGLEQLEKTTGALIKETILETPPSAEDYPPQSPAQSKFVADKLENVTQELFELKVEHESTLNECDILRAKYEEAIRTLAELQDAVDEARHPAATPTVTSPTPSRPVSFLGEARMNELKSAGHSISSRSLSSELSLAGESTHSEITEVTEVTITPAPNNEKTDDETDTSSHTQVTELQGLLHEQQAGLEQITQQYAQLKAEHENTLEIVEDLRTEVSRARSVPPASPTQLQPVIRRMTSQASITVDRAHRSLASLRNIAVEEFENRPEAMQTFENNLNTAMHELHNRLERIHALEAENKSVKKEMEMKTTIISGLTRERNSISASSPIDHSFVTQMQEQLAKSENQIRMLQENHAVKEGQLVAEMKLLQEALDVHRKDATDASDAEKHDEIMKLQTELSKWEGKHQATLENLNNTESKLSTTLAELETALSSLEAIRSEKSAAADATDAGQAEAAILLETEKSKHSETQRELDEHKFLVESHVSKIAELEASHSTLQQEFEQFGEHKKSIESEIETHKSRASELETLVNEHKAANEATQAEIVTLKDSHAKKVEELEASLTVAETEKHAQLTEQAEQHEKAIAALKLGLENSQNELQTLVQSLNTTLQIEGSASDLPETIKSLLAEKSETHEKYTALVASQESLERQLEEKTGGHADLEKQLADLNGQVARRDELTQKLAETIALHEESIREKEGLIKKKDATIQEISAEKDKSARLVEELEEQITNSFDQHHNRLSVIQQERNVALEEAKNKIAVLEKDLEGSKARVEQLEVSHERLHEFDALTDLLSQVQSRRGSAQPEINVERTASLTSNLRKSSSHTSLPSPPPAIPLPPIPQMGNGNATSPPSSRHASKELVSAQLVEDQEARIRTIEKHLHAEKQLTATLEEALMDLETQSNKVKTDMESWKKKAWAYEDELTTLRKERNSTRMSIQAVEEERSARREAEAARAQLEERMNALSKKKKKSGLNCF